jgi:hypothetical protein
MLRSIKFNDVAVVGGIRVGRREVFGEYTGKNLKRLIS